MKLITVLCCIFTCSSLFAQVAERAEDISPLLVGEKIPDVTLQTMDGKSAGTASLWEGRKTILIIYRGGWCPYCNMHLSEVGEIQQDLLDLGYTIMAVSPDAPAQLKKSVDKNNLGYSLYADEGGAFIKALGLAFKATERSYKRLDEYSEGKNREHLLPVPALFVVNEQGEIVFEYINPTYKARVSKDLLLAAATALAKEV